MHSIRLNEKHRAVSEKDKTTGLVTVKIMTNHKYDKLKKSFKSRTAAKNTAAQEAKKRGKDK